MLTQYDIEEVQEYCHNLFSQQEIVSLYERFCQLDGNGKGFISADEFLSVPEFAMNPLSQRLLKMVDGLNFKDFVAFLSSFSAKASMEQKIGLIFKVYDSDGNGKVSFDDILEVLRNLSGAFMSDEQREHVLSHCLKEAGYTRDSYLMLDNFVKVTHAERLHALQKLEEILHQEMEITSLQLQNLPTVELLKGSAGSSNQCKSIDVLKEEKGMQRMRINNGQEMLRAGSSSGKKVLKVGEAKQQLHEKLKRLEEENESMKKEFFEHLEESKKLMNEICQAISQNTSFASARIMSCE